MNAQWSEQTSLRLLELITASVDSSAPMQSTPRAMVDSARLGKVMRELACSDAAFRSWLELRVHTASGSLAVNIVTGEANSDAHSNTHVAQGSAQGNAHSDAVSSVVGDADVTNLQWLQWLADAEAETAVAGGTLLCAPQVAAPIFEQATTGFAASAATASEDGNAQLATSERLASLVRSMARLALRYQNVGRLAKASEADVACRLAYDMAYGLSHELNNPLANIASRARLLSEQEASEPKRQLLAGIVDQAMRGCEMIADLMLVARPPVLKPESIDLSLLVEQLSGEARPWLSARGLIVRVKGESELSDKLSVSARPTLLHRSVTTVMTDRAAAREALWALLRNAIEAARHQILISIAIRTLATKILISDSVLAEETTQPITRRFVEVSIFDDGAGLSEHALEHAWNPYFSGREAGRGLGLGLSKADRLARLSGGYVCIENLSEGGCAARIAWPCCED